MSKRLGGCLLMSKLVVVLQYGVICHVFLSKPSMDAHTINPKVSKNLLNLFLSAAIVSINQHLT